MTRSGSIVNRLVGSCLIAKRMVWEIDHESTGRRARQAREKAGLSLREIARRMGVSAPYLSDLERGRRPWNADRAPNATRAIVMIMIDNRILESISNTTEWYMDSTELQIYPGKKMKKKMGQGIPALSVL